MQFRRLFYYFILLGLTVCYAGSYWTLFKYPGSPVDNSPALFAIELFNAALSHVLLAALIWRIFKIVQKSQADTAEKLFVGGLFSDGVAMISIGVLQAFYITKNWRTFYIDGDEFFQAVGALWHPTLQAAAEQHQQPLGYAANRFVETLLGLSEFSIRLPSAIYGALSGMVFFLLLRNLKVNRSVAWIVSLFFCFSYHLDRFSHETRPQALAFLTCLIFLNFSFSVFKDQSSEAPSDLLIDLGFGVLFFSLSIGLQPIAFIALFMFLTFLFFGRDRRFKFFALTVGLAIVPAMINAYAVKRFAPQRIVDDLLASGLQFVNGFFNNPWDQVLLSPYPWSLLLILLFSVTVFMSFRKKISFSKWNYILFLQWFFYPLLLFIAFKITINNLFFIRYCIVLIIPAWVTLGLSADYLFAFIKPGLRMTGLGLLFFGMLSVAMTEPREEGDLDIQNRQNSQGMYRKLSESLGPDDWAVPIVVRRYSFDDAYEGVMYVKNFHSPKNSTQPFHAPLSVIHYLGDIADAKRPHRLIFFFQAKADVLKLIETSLKRLPYLHPFIQEHGYLSYEYVFNGEPLISQEFIGILEQKILPAEDGSRFQGPVLELTNAIQQKDQARIDALKLQIEQMFPRNLATQLLYYNDLKKNNKF